MTSFPPEPEFWVEDAVDDGSGRTWDEWPEPEDDGGDGAPPEGPQPPPRPRRWPRWVTVGAGLAVIAGLIAWQNRSGSGPDASSETTTQTSPLTTPSTWAPTATGPATAENGTPAVPASGTAALGGGDAVATTVLPPTSGTAWLPRTSDLRIVNRELAGETWELVGYGDDGVTRYIPATGELITTQVLRSIGGGPLALLVTANATIIRPFDTTTGFLVPDGGPAEPLAGLLDGGGGTFPGPTPDSVWVVGRAGTATTDPFSDYAVPPQGAKLVLVDEHGIPQGVTLDIPETAGEHPDYAMVPDGTGFVLFYGIGGLYRLGPDGSRLVTHGQVVAFGPATMLLDECDEHAQCSLVVFDRVKDERRPLPGTAAAKPSEAARGTTSPDGRWAAVLDPIKGSVTLIDLETGMATTPFSDGGWHPTIRLASDVLAFTPDSRFLLIASGAGVSVIDTEHRNPRGLLPIRSQQAIAIRPGS